MTSARQWLPRSMAAERGSLRHTQRLRDSTAQSVFSLTYWITQPIGTVSATLSSLVVLVVVVTLMKQYALPNTVRAFLSHIVTLRRCLLYLQRTLQLYRTVCFNSLEAAPEEGAMHDRSGRFHWSCLPLRNEESPSEKTPPVV